MKSIANTTVISNFATVGRLDLLRCIVKELYIPVEVYEEVKNGQAAGYTFYDGIEQLIVPFSSDGWLRLVSMNETELQLFASLPSGLQHGEVACLAIARNRGWGFLSDDRLARRQAEVWNLTLSGTMGLLLLAVEDRLISLSEGNALLRQMIADAKYRAPHTDLLFFLP
jgi:predicted nucleic acid-binding protein